MKLVRFGPVGREQPGVWLEQERSGPPAILDVRAMAFDIRDYDAHFFSRWGFSRLQALLREPNRKVIPAAGVRLGAPVARPGKIVCLGANYADHAAEFGSPVPKSPIFFSKATTSLQGPFDPIVIPRGATCIDTEAELAVVIGRHTRRVSPADAWSCVAGYTALNDVTDREAQRAGQQWFRGKSPDTFCPLGPFLVSADEIADPHRLQIFSRLNGQPVQQGNSADLIFKIPELISFLSAAITLEAGDILSTGTPAGVGSARQPPLFIKPGDTVEVGVESLGTQINAVMLEGEAPAEPLPSTV